MEGIWDSGSNSANHFFFLILSFTPTSELSPPSISYSLSISLYANHNPLFFFLLYFPEHSLTTHKGLCLADRSCNYLLVLTRVQRSEISISNNNGVWGAGSCMLGIWQLSRPQEPTAGEGNPHRGPCPREGGHGHPLFLLREDDQLVLQYHSCKSCLYSHSFWCVYGPMTHRRSFLLQLPSWLLTLHNIFFSKEQIFYRKIDHQITHISEEIFPGLLK